MADAADALTFPAEALPWIEQQTGGRIRSIERMTVRREAWRALVEDASGAQRPYFLRIDRAVAAGRPYPRDLERETALIRWLAANTGIPTQKIIGWHPGHAVAIQSFEPGRADLHNATRAEQHDVMLHFMDIMAEMHRIDVGTLDLPRFEIPATPEDHSLMELRAVDDPRLARLPVDASTLLGAFGKRWLLNHVPRSVERTVLLQGDTGPGNFLFSDHRVTAVVDWEWAHYGDPMEDVGNLWLRDFFTPGCGGDLTPYVRHYAAKAGVSVDRQKAIYYLVHQLVRSVVTLPALAKRPDWKSTVALNLGYQAVCDITCCEALGLYHGLVEEPLAPLGQGAQGSSRRQRDGAAHDATADLLRVLAEQLEHGIAPELPAGFARMTASGGAQIARYLDNLHRHGAEADALEREGIESILGQRFDDVALARPALAAVLPTLAPADETRVLRHCWRVARRNMQLMEPLVVRWSGCRLPVLHASV
jgi:aminoglycoside phosphotransferase (APT) family kinase protein